MTDSNRPARLRRRLGLAAGLLVAAAGAGLLVASLTSGDAASATGSAARAGSAERVGGPVSVARRVAAPAVPWAKVGSGWTVATWAARPGASAELYLVGPAGQRYPIAALPAGSAPSLWSPDAQRVLYAGSGYRELNLRTGVSRRVALPAGELVGYSRPKGLAVLEAVYVAHGTPRLERFGTDGRRQLVYPAAEPGAGALSPYSVVETADGTQLVVGAAHGLVLLRNDGTLVRRLAIGSAACTPVSWWSGSAALASCAGRLWSVPTSGAAPHPLTAGPRAGYPFGYSDEWRAGAAELGLAPNGCGPASVVRFDRTGQGHRVAVPSPIRAAGQSAYVGHHDVTVELVFTAGSGCRGGAQTLFGYDAATGRSSALLGPGVNGGSVIAAVPFPGDA